MKVMDFLFLEKTQSYLLNYHHSPNYYMAMSCFQEILLREWLLEENFINSFHFISFFLYFSMNCHLFINLFIKQQVHFLGIFSLMINFEMKINNSFFEYHFHFQADNLHSLADIDCDHDLKSTFSLNIETVNWNPFIIQLNHFLIIQYFIHLFSLNFN